MSDALVLAGGALKGAFTAGALSVLSRPDVLERADMGVTRIVGASSGALNGAYYAGAIHAGTEAGAGQRLVDLWLDDATFGGAFDPSLRDLASGLGLSTDRRIVDLLRSAIRPTDGDRPIELRLAVTNVDGTTVSVGGEPATTFELIADFSGPDFTTAASLERLYLAVAASAALPGAYAPVPFDVDGRTVHGLDGGLVDDAPLGDALARAPAVDRVFVIAPFPRVRVEPASLHGIPLASHVLDVLVQERLFRDLRRATHVNEVLARLPALIPDEAQRSLVLEALGWTARRQVEIVEIRPRAELPGDVLGAFASRALRQQYVQAGIDAAERALSDTAT
jgi:predicted acylesterase/phospholipase RssA